MTRRLRIPADIDLIAAVNGALLALVMPFNWEQHGTLTPEETAELMAAMYDEYVRSTNEMIGVVFPYASATNPTHSLVCDGSTHLRTDYPTLYAVLDSTFVDDADTFHVPDLRGRAAIGIGAGSGLSSYGMGDSDGTERVTLVVSEIPNHTHSEIGAVSTIINGGLEAPASAATAFGTSTGGAGGGSSHNNMSPFQALGYAIWAE